MRSIQCTHLYEKFVRKQLIMFKNEEQKEEEERKTTKTKVFTE